MKNFEGFLPLHLLPMLVRSSPVCTSQMIKSMFELVCSDSLINTQDSCGDTALHIACRSVQLFSDNQFLFIQYLLEEKHASISISNVEGKLPMHVYLTSLLAKINVLELLLYDVNIPDSERNTPLHLACMYQSEKVISYLVKSAGAFVDIQNNKGQLPLHLILERRCRNFYVINLLITETNLSIQDHDGNTPLHIGWQFYENELDWISQLSYERKIIWMNKYCRKSICIALGLSLMMASTTLNNSNKNAFDILCITNEKSYTPLQYLLKHGSYTALRYFQTLFSLDHHRYNKIFCSDLCLNPLTADFKLLCSLANSLNVKVRDDDGRTILHVACNHFNFEKFIEFFKWNNYIHNIQDSDGNIPLHYCAKNRHIN